MKNEIVVAGVKPMMKTALLRHAGSLFLVTAMLLVSHCANGQEDVARIIQRSSEANERDLAAVSQFDNSERDRDKHGDKTYAVTMLFGSPYQRLIAVNGRPLDGAKQKEEQEKYEEAVKQREHESEDKRSERIAKYQAELKRDRTLLQQMTAAFDFRLLGKRHFNGYPVFVLKATPRKGYQPPDRDSQVLTGMEGTLWIERKSFHWVKVEAHVIHPVRIEGFLAEVEPGTKFELEKRPVDGNIWLASHYSMRSNAKVVLLIPHSGQEDDSYFDYHRTSDASNKSSGRATGSNNSHQ